jgi:hypothetical protein
MTVNAWAAKYGGQFAADHKHVTVRTIKMTRRTADHLQYSSKFDRSGAFLEKMRTEGQNVARAWLNNWPHVGGEFHLTCSRTGVRICRSPRHGPSSRQAPKVRGAHALAQQTRSRRRYLCCTGPSLAGRDYSRRGCPAAAGMRGRFAPVVPAISTPWGRFTGFTTVVQTMIDRSGSPEAHDGV